MRLGGAFAAVKSWGGGDQLLEVNVTGTNTRPWRQVLTDQLQNSSRKRPKL